MNLILSHYHLPFTRIIILCCLASIITSFIALCHAWNALIIIFALLFFIGYKAKTYRATILLCVLTGLFIYLRINHIQSSFHQDNEYLGKPVTVHATIQQIQQNNLDKKTTTLIAQTKTIHSDGAKATSKQKTISIQILYTRKNALKIGQDITLHNVILNKPSASGPIYENPYYLYLIKENIWANAYIASEKLIIINHNNQSWYHYFLHFLSNYFSTTTQQLYNPLFLGKKEKNDISLRIQHQSQYWGIAHHMARSGIHLVTLLELCIAIFHYARIRSKFRFILYTLFIAGYGMITISSISFIRSMCMIMMQIFSKFHGFQYSSIHALALTTFLVVAYNPLHVLFLDFQLSFGITAIIIWLFYIKWAKTVAFPSTFLLPF